MVSSSIYVYLFKKSKNQPANQPQKTKRTKFIQAVIDLFQLKMQLSLIPGKNKFVRALILHSATYPEKLLRTTKYRAVISKFLHKT